MTRSQDRYEAEVLRWAADILRRRRTRRNQFAYVLGTLELAANKIWKRPPMEEGEPMYKVWDREEAARTDAAEDP